MIVGNGPMNHPMQRDVPYSKRRTIRRMERTVWKTQRPVGVMRYTASSTPTRTAERAARQRQHMETWVRRAFGIVTFGALLTVLRALWGTKPVAL